ncbi:MAG: M23 family metallopeptidase, partial [Gammaproteobacteria bacterium]|nr:M23 family metallopeptidase [Gammaproteobacteria bacterium]
FGRRNDPFTGKPAWHEGIDFAGKEGSEIMAVAAGVVTWSGDRYGYGNLVEVSHGGSYVTRYAHAKKLLVKVGDVVAKGQVVALMGSSGRSTGPHVHFEVLRNGKPVDPLRYVRRKRK